jgi:endo-1,3-1,4-beta-glycanase ExoK
MTYRRMTGAAVLWICAAPVLGQDGAGFVEEFDRLDRDRWFISDGWRNGDHQSCDWTAGAVTLEDGVLRVTLDQTADGGLICGEVQSRGRFGFGTIEARVRVPYAPGTNANVFTFIGPPQGLPHDEIDFEFIAPRGPSLQTNTYVGGVGGREQIHQVPAEDAWLDLAVVWEPGRLRWFMDGMLIREETGEAVPGGEEHKLYLSIWSTATLTDWLGTLEWSEPLVLEVERVAFTPLGDACGFEASILCADIEGGVPAAP